MHITEKLILGHYTGKLETLSPLSTLERGYNICIHARTNKVVKQLNDVEKGDSIVIVLSDGSLLCDVKDIKVKGDNH